MGLKNRIELDEPCCAVWSNIMGYFDWYHFEDDPNILTTPHIKVGEHRYFVNHCPSCGSDVRNYTMKKP